MKRKSIYALVLYFGVVLIAYGVSADEWWGVLGLMFPGGFCLGFFAGEAVRG